jgi:hypothetical protein
MARKHKYKTEKSNFLLIFCFSSDIWRYLWFHYNFKGIKNVNKKLIAGTQKLQYLYFLSEVYILAKELLGSSSY